MNKNLHASHAKQGYRYLDLFTTLFIASLLAANIIAVKIIQIGPFTLPAGTAIFPVSYIVNDVLTEVYGFKTTRRVIWMGFFANLFLVIAIWIGQILPGATVWDAQSAYVRILGTAPRILLASFAAYLLGSFSNAWIMSRLKHLTHGRLLWTRTIGSTIVGEGIDSVIFMSVGFFGIIPSQTLIGTVLSVWIIKTIYEVLATPITYLIISGVKHIEARRRDEALTVA